MDGFEKEQEIEEDDCENFFLQPASSPYNIAEKIQQANIDLFSDNCNETIEKTSRVKFRVELTSYEPEQFSTDDDVNSLESDPPESPQTLEYKRSNVINLKIFDISEDEEIIEEILPEDEEILLDCKNEPDNALTAKTSSEDRSSKRRKVRNKSASKTYRNFHVDCRNHCIERLDFDMSMSIKKLEIQEKPVKCPMLKLQPRKCCDENKLKNPMNLPCYNGLRSEYGLSSEELVRRERRKEMMRQKEEKQRQLMREYKNRKNQQNEEVFSQWLKGVARRQKQKIDNTKQCFSPNVISFPTKLTEKLSERPKTANEFVPRQRAKKAKRPSTACVFIQVPEKLLQRGIHIGNLIVTNSRCASKKMHVLRVSS